MKIIFDRSKRDRCLTERGLAFEDAAEVFAGFTLDIDDLRRDYGERRVITFGHLRGRLVCLVWTPRGSARHIISMQMTARKGALHSNLAKADRRGVTAEDLAEIPEVPEEDFARAKPHVGGVEVKRGRPKLAEPKEHVNLRLSRRVLDHFRHQGRGWQTRISEILERHVARAHGASKQTRRSDDL